MMLKDLGNEQCSHILCFNSLLDWQEVCLFTKAAYNSPNYCVDLGNPKTKSMDMLCQGASGIGNGCNNPDAFPLSYLTF